MLWRTLGHGDAFVFRDPAGLDQLYQDDEIVVVASETSDSNCI
jgi:amidophosphoribosyltransferase